MPTLVGTSNSCIWWFFLSGVRQTNMVISFKEWPGQKVLFSRNGWLSHGFSFGNEKLFEVKGKCPILIIKNCGILVVFKGKFD